MITDLTSIKKFIDGIENDSISEKEINEFIEGSWAIFDMCLRVPLSEKVVASLKDVLNWSALSCRTEYLSEDFLIEHKNRLDLNTLVITRRDLSEDFFERLGLGYVMNHIKPLRLHFHQPKLSANFINKMLMLQELEK